jgi:hypothetical protein
VDLAPRQPTTVVWHPIVVRSLQSPIGDRASAISGVNVACGDMTPMNRRRPR